MHTLLVVKTINLCTRLPKEVRGGFLGGLFVWGFFMSSDQDSLPFWRTSFTQTYYFWC